MSKRYRRIYDFPFRIALIGFPGGGKSELALCPHPDLGEEPDSVEYWAFDEGAEYLEGIPAESVANGRVKVVQPGWLKGKRRTGLDYVGAVVDRASQIAKGTKLVILDTMNRFAELVKDDLIGKTKDDRKAYFEGQKAAVAVYATLYRSNPDTSIILLHHLDEITHMEPGSGSGEVPIFDTFTAALVGKALQRKWEGRFTAVLQAECRVVPKIEVGKKDVKYEHKYFLLLRPRSDSKLLKIRAGVGMDVPPEIDCTVQPAKDGQGANLEPLLGAWDKVFQLLDSAAAARAARAKQEAS